VCEALDCNNKCAKPTNCAKPKCELQCEKPACELPETPSCCPCSQASNAQVAVVVATQNCQAAQQSCSNTPSFLEVMNEMTHQAQNGKEQCCPCSQ